MLFKVQQQFGGFCHAHVTWEIVRKMKIQNVYGHAQKN